MSPARQLGLVLCRVGLPVGSDDAHPAKDQTYQRRPEKAELRISSESAIHHSTVVAQKWMARP